MADVRLATVAAFQHIFETDELLHGLVRRQALKDWVDLLAVSHPLDRWVVSEAIHAGSACQNVAEVAPMACEQPIATWLGYTRGGMAC